MPAKNKPSNRLRLEIAHTAARFVAVDGINDYLSAKKKAALQLGIDPGRNNMPTNREVEQALEEYQQLFQAGRQREQLRDKRGHALHAMQFLDCFKPRLAGPVLTGTATPHSEIALHLYCDNPEQVWLFLDEGGIPYTCCERSLRISPAESVTLPACRFIAENNTFVLIIFAGKHRNITPLSSIDGRPMQRATAAKVAGLID